MPEDESYLNKRGLTHFWENIDDIKQNKLTAGAGILITNDVISATGGGTADAVDWGHITGLMSNQTDLTTALAAKANSADLATVATSGDYDDLTDKPTIGNATLTIQKNGTSAGTFTANATSNKTINITVPTTAADVSALPASTKYGASIAVSINTTDYKVTTTLKDQDGNTLGTAQVIDLPLESVVVNGSYDSTNKKIVLTLQSGSTIDIPVADLVAGLQSEITSTNKLASDLVDDTNQTNKFMTSAEKTKLSGIATGAEVNVQSDWNQTTTTADDYIKNKPSIPTKTSDLTNDSNFVSDASYVHTDNNYTTTEKNKLSGIAAGAEVNVQANWTQTTTTADDYIKNKPTLATVATSGSYNDLSNKPTIPTVNNATLTIQKNGTNVQTFTANQSTNATANITVPTKTSDLTNDSGFLDSVAWGDVTGKPTFATVATSGSYNDLSNKPTIPAAQVNSDWDAVSGVAQILNKPTLATVATSGSYNDLTDTPIIPSGVTLYTGLGENTDGALTQKATRELFYNDSAMSKMKIGTLAFTTDTFGNHSTSIGDLSRAGAIEGTALGYNARTTGDYTVAIGSNASIGNRTRASVIGYMSSARAADAVALGSYALATREYEVNIGTAMGGAGYDNTQTRLLGGVHAGLLDTDAVNVGQLNTALSDYATTTDLATKQNLLSPGNHIDITSDVISATGYVHSENPQAAAAASSTITGSMIASGTITADKLASGATVQLTLSTSDIGEGSPLAANTLYGVYI